MKTKFYKLLFIFCLYAIGYSQTGIGTYSAHDGGFENQATGNVQAGSTTAVNLSATTWSASTTSSAAITRAILATGGRTGPQCASFGSLSTSQKFFYSPVISGASFAPNTKYQIQFFYKPSTTTAVLASSSVNLIIDNASLTAAPASIGTIATVPAGLSASASTSTWTKVAVEVTSGSTVGTNAVAAIAFTTSASSTNFTASFDDFVIYQANAADNTAPNSPGAITATGAVSGGSNVSWGSASGGIDGGGYVVVRYATTAPSASDDVVQNGIYKFANTVGAGVVRYIGSGTSFTDSGLSPGVDYYYKVYTVDKAFNYSDESVTSTPVQSLATTYYYNGTGLLTDVASWGQNTNGTGTAPANFTDASQVFEIRNTTAVTLDGTWTVGLDPANGTKVRLGNTDQAAITLTLNSGASIGPSGTGNFDVMAPSSGNQKVVYKNTTAISLGSIFDANFEVEYDGVTISSSTTKSFGTISIINGANVTLSATPVIKNINVDATSTLVTPTSASSAFITIPSGGSVVINGTVRVPKLSGFVASNVVTANDSFGAIQFLGSENLTLGANSTVEYVRTATGAQTVSARTDYKNLILTGTTPKTVNGPTTVSGTLTINQTTAVTLTGDVLVNGTLSFVLGKITTGVNTLTIGTSGTISGANQATGWVIGNLKKQTASSFSPSFTYAIGDANNYTPLALTFSGTTSAAGGLTAKINIGDHAQVATSGIDNTKSVNKTWTLTNDALTGFGTYSAAFAYSSADIDGISTPANYVVAQYDGSTWSNRTVSGTPTDTATIATGISSFGDFAIGECTPTTSSVSESACGTSYTWPLSGQTYNASGSYNYVVGCNTTTLNLTLTPATNNTTAVSSFLTYTWANNGQTYTTSGIKTGTTTNCVTELLDLTITTTQIPTTFPAFCKGATIATATGTTSLKFYAAATGGTALASTTALANAKTLWVTEVINSLETTPRVSRLITVNNLPATPSAVVSNPIGESKNICKYIGSSTPVTFDATAVGAVSYIWSVPAGASIVTGGTGASIGLSFAGASTTAGAIGSVAVQSVDANGCASLPKSLAIITKVPTAPASLVMTSTDTTPHFDVKDPLTSIVSTVGLNTLTKITKVGPYMGTPTVFTLTAPTAPTAASYAWTLPSGATQLSGGTSNVITADFAGVASGIGALPVSVQSVGGCGSSALRTLTLARAVPGAPKALTLTNSTEPSLSSLSKITKVGPYTGTSIAFTLTATPVRVQGATATSYAWVLPTGVNCTSPNTTGTTPLTGITASVPWSIANYIVTASNTITVNFSGVSGTGNLDLLVFGVNGAGNSAARKLVVARATPTAPSALVLRDGATVVTKVGAYTAKTTALTLTATPVTTQGAEATSFSWLLPAGVNVTAGATLVTDNGATKTYSGTATVLTVNLAGIGTGIVSIPLSVQAVNGAGTSLTTRTLTVTAAVPATPSIVGSSTTFNTCSTRTYTATSLSTGITSYTWTIPAGATIVGDSNGNVIVVEFSATTFALGASSAVTCYATNGTGNSAVKSLTVKKAADTCKDANTTGASAFNVIAYPNPSSDIFNIEVTSGKGATTFEVYDMQGRLIENRKANSNSVQVGSRYAAGAYNVIVKQGANTKTLRVIKK